MVEYVDLTLDSSDEDSDTTNEQILITVDSIPFTTRHQRILLSSNEWLTDEIINAFSLRISSFAPFVHCCSTFFFAKLSMMERKELDKQWLDKWKRRVGEEKRDIFIPVNWNNSHWALVVFRRTERKLLYYDSMMSGSRSRQALSIVKMSFEYCFPSTERRPKNEQIGLAAFIVSRLSLITTNTHTSVNIQTETPRDQPQQTDGSSCGVFACWWMAVLSGYLHSARPNPSSFRRLILKVILANENGKSTTSKDKL